MSTFDLGERQVAPIVRLPRPIDERKDDLERHELFRRAELTPREWLLTLLGRTDPGRKSDADVVPGQRRKQEVERDVAHDVGIQAAQNFHSSRRIRPQNDTAAQMWLLRRASARHALCLCRGCLSQPNRLQELP